MRRFPWLELSAALLFLASLALPAVWLTKQPFHLDANPDPEMIYGIQCLIFGFVLFPGWLANPLLFVAAPLHFVHKRTAAIVLMVLAVISAAIAPLLLYGEMRVGYFVWLASHILMLAATIKKRRVQSPHDLTTG